MYTELLLLKTAKKNRREQGKELRAAMGCFRYDATGLHAFLGAESGQKCEMGVRGIRLGGTQVQNSSGSKLGMCAERRE